MSVDTLVPPDHVWERPLYPLVEQTRYALMNALGPAPVRCEVGDAEMSLIVQPLDNERCMIVGKRAFTALHRPRGRDDRPFVDADCWEVGIVRYYGREWATSDFAHAAETILDDFALEVFVREWQQHHCER